MGGSATDLEGARLLLSAKALCMRRDDLASLKPIALIPLLISALVGAAIQSCAGPGSRGTRVVFITLDTLRYDSFAGGTDRATSMPRIRARAEGCLVFDRFYTATSTTQPTHATLFTALHPWQHGVTRNGQTLTQEHATVAEMLKNAGFRTAAVVASFPLSQRFGLNQGFDEYHDDFSQVLEGQEGWEGVENPPTGAFYSLAENVTDAAMDVLDRYAGDKRQFFWFHYFDPHGPYGDSFGTETVGPGTVLIRVVRDGANAREELLRARHLYDQDVSYLDRSLDRLFQRLSEDEGDFENHVLVVSDHGESFGEDGSVGHGRRLTEGQIHVPFFICSPKIRPGLRDDVAGSIDVTPTILSLADAKSATPSGRDLTKVPGKPRLAFGMRRTFGAGALDFRLDGSTHPVNMHLFYMVDEDGMIYHGNGEEVLPEGADGSKTIEKDLARRLTTQFAAFEAELGSEADPGIDPETQRALRALGYVQ